MVPTDDITTEVMSAGTAMGIATMATITVATIVEIFIEIEL